MSVSTTTVTVAPPARAGLVLAVPHVAAGVAACFLPFPAALITILGVVVSAASVARPWFASVACERMARLARPTRGGRRSGTPGLPAMLHLRPDGSLLATDRAGVTTAGVLVSGRILGAPLIALAVRLEPMDAASVSAGRTRRLIRLLLLAGDQSHDDLRALRVWLRWQRPATGDHRLDRVDSSPAGTRPSRLDIFRKKCVASLNSVRESRSHRVDAAAGGRSVPGGAAAPDPGSRRGGGS